MTTPKEIGGNEYKAALDALKQETDKLVRLTEQMAANHLDKTTRSRLKAEIAFCLLRQKQYEEILDRIGKEAKQGRRKEKG